MNSFKVKTKKLKKKHDKKKHKKEKKKCHSSSSSDSSSDSDSSSTSSSSDGKKKHKKRKSKDHKRKRCKASKITECNKIGECSTGAVTATARMSDEDFSIPIGLMHTRHKVPETKEEYEKRQSVIRRVVDPESGRTRLIKGDGEILEEIVTKDRHQEINRLATQTDGQIYQNKTIGWAVTSDKK